MVTKSDCQEANIPSPPAIMPASVPSNITCLRPTRSISQVAGLIARTVPTTTSPTGKVASSGAGASSRP